MLAEAGGHHSNESLKVNKSVVLLVKSVARTNPYLGEYSIRYIRRLSQNFRYLHACIDIGDQGGHFGFWKVQLPDEYR